MADRIFEFVHERHPVVDILTESGVMPRDEAHRQIVQSTNRTR